jgi:hypothetical protein
MVVSGQHEGGGGARLVRALVWVIFALMAASSLYTAWIAITNFNRIGV